MKSAARAPSPRCSRRILRLRTASRIRKKRLRASCPQNRNISSPPRSSTPSRLACATSCSRPRPRTTRPASPLCAPRPSNPKSSRMATIRIAPTTIVLRSSVVPILNRDQRTLKTNLSSRAKRGICFLLFPPPVISTAGRNLSFIPTSFPRPPLPVIPSGTAICFLLSPPLSTFNYDDENHLKTAGGVTYTYDGEGRRAQKSNGKLYWYGTGSTPLDESDASGTITDEFVFFGG